MRTLCSIFTTVSAALALAACGSQSGRPAGSPRDAALDGALRFARCMRGEGLNFPDPKRAGNGLIKITAAEGARPNPDDPRFKAANDKCAKHLQAGGGDARDPAKEARLQDAFLRYARCMRRAGVDVPDPTPGKGGGIISRAGGPDAPDPESPSFKAADRTCHALLAEVDKAVQGERSGS